MIIQAIADLAREHADPTDPVHQQVVANVTRGADLTERCRLVAAEAHRLLDAGDLEAALPLVEQHKLLTEELNAITRAQVALGQAHAQPGKIQ